MLSLTTQTSGNHFKNIIGQHRNIVRLYQGYLFLAITNLQAKNTNLPIIINSQSGFVLYTKFDGNYTQRQLLQFHFEAIPIDESFATSIP